MKYSVVVFSSLCLVIPLCLSIIPPVQSQCLADQRSLLLQLKQSLQFDSSRSTKLVTWNSDHDCCGWSGVTCDQLGRVTGLDLGTESISGGIESSSSHLFRLQYLETLNLAYNSFEGESISSGFGKLSNLRYLNLSDAGFAGQIPIQISYLTSLETLHISSFFSTDLKLEKPNLGMLVQNLTGLIQLHLGWVNISGMGEEWCRALSSSLPNLQVLSLSNCDLAGPICSSLQNLHSLSAINLGHNGLYGTVPSSLFELTSLRKLDLSFNQFGGRVDEFSNASSSPLEILDLGSNNLQGPIPVSFFELPSLQQLDLSFNQFGGQIGEFSNASSGPLKILDLSNNNLQGSVPMSFFELPLLQQLDLSSNQFGGRVDEFSIASSSPLEKLDLSNNSFQGTVPMSFFELPLLQQLDLSFNQFGGQIDEFSNASSSPLEKLDLSSNNLQGPVPMSFFELASLQQLILSSNNFSGTIGLQAIHRLCNLSQLHLSNNSLSLDSSDNNLTFSCISQLEELYFDSCKQQTFPDLRTLSRLYELDLSDNQIVGDIPKWIWEVGLFQLNLSNNLLTRVQEPYVFPPDLNILDLHSNQICGEIPLPKELASATHIDYSSNNFSSTIPVDIGNNLSDLVFFSLSTNFIEGTIPQSLCNASTLQYLDLSNNDLSGTIPSCLLERHPMSLQLLNLRNNKLSGYIPMTFQKEKPCKLKALYLDGNHLEGHVPKSLGNCNELEVLNLGKNDINDTFPCFLKNLSSLQILFLQSNHFHGDICCEGDERGGWPNLQIIDLSFNNFDGNLPLSFFSNLRAMMYQNSKVNYLDLRGLYTCTTRDGNAIGTSDCNNVIQSYEKATVTNKGLKRDLDKIFSSFTYIDFSSNRFHGKIPDTIGDLNLLIVLNLSNNALVGTIPTPLGNLKNLESLDLSQNKLGGRIPSQLASLTFLSFLNVSHNLLVGMIPIGPQFQTFPPTSFQGNKALCGAPLINERCKDTSHGGSLPPLHDENKHLSFLEPDVYVSVEVGFVVGLAFTVGPIVFSRRWRWWFYRQVDRFLLRTWERRRRERQTYRNPIQRLLV